MFLSLDVQWIQCIFLTIFLPVFILVFGTTVAHAFLIHIKCTNPCGSCHANGKFHRLFIKMIHVLSFRHPEDHIHRHRHDQRHGSERGESNLDIPHLKPEDQANEHRHDETGDDELVHGALLELVVHGDGLVDVAVAGRHRSGDHVRVLRREGDRGPEGDGVAVEEGRQLRGDLSAGEEDIAGEVTSLDLVQADLYGAIVSGLVCL